MRLVLVIALSTGLHVSATTTTKPKPATSTKKQATKKKSAKSAPKPSLRGSKAVARQQNTQADKERLTRLADEKQLEKFIKAGILVAIPENLYVTIDPRLDKTYRYCRPWTRDFLNDLGKAHYNAFKKPIRVNSAVRPISRQTTLRKRNSNAAPTIGPYRSSHPTASTVDIAKGENAQWFRDYLRNNMRNKKKERVLTVVEEWKQPVFHVMVFKNYGQKKVVASKRPATPPGKSQKKK